MKFFKTIQNSIYSPSFYNSLTKKSFKSSFVYFLLLALILTILRLITLTPLLFVEAPKALSSFTQSIIDCYPKDLEVKIQNGQASSNVKEPYFIKSCVGDKSQNLIVIDTKNAYSQTQFDDYKIGAWLTKDAVAYKKNNYETRTYTLTQVKDFKINKQVIDSYYKMFSPYLKFVGPILLLFTFLGIYLSYDFRLLHLLLISSLIWLLGKLFKYTLSYGQLYKLGLHAITLGLIVQLIVDLTSPWTKFYGFPFMVSVFTLGVVVVNLFLN